MIKLKHLFIILTLISLLYQIVNVFQENEEKKVGKRNIKCNRPSLKSLEVAKADQIADRYNDMIGKRSGI